MRINVIHQSSLTAVATLVAICAVAFWRYDGAAVMWTDAASAVMTAITAFVLCRTILHCGVLDNYCFLPMPLYAIVACGISITPQNLETSAAALLIVLSMNSMLVGYINRHRLGALLNVSLAASTAVLIYPPAVTYVMMLPVIMVICNLPWRHGMVLITGYLLVPALVGYGYWLTGHGFATIFVNRYRLLMTDIGAVMPDRVTYAAYAMGAIVLLLTLAGIVTSLSERFHIVSSTKICYTYIIWLAVCSVAMFAFRSVDVGVLPLIGLPTTVMATVALKKGSGAPADLVYVSLLALFVINLILQ